MLAGAGHDVHLHTVTNSDIRGLSAKIRLLWETAYSSANERMMTNLIAEIKPDVVHVHNFFPLLTPAVHVATARAGIGVVQTLHNYRLFCAAATFERDGQVCELCLHGSRFNALRHRCYRGSLPATAALVHMQNVNDNRRLLARHVHRFIALTSFARHKYIEAGLPAERITVKPNFLDRAATDRDSNAPRSGALFVGRLSQEKGVDVLLRAWRELPEVSLRIAGDGPLRQALERRAPAGVEFLGRLDGARIAEEMRAASLLLVPSLWYEGFPMTILEAFSTGLPVAASRLGSLQEIITPHRNGMLFEPGSSESLARVVRELLASPARLLAMGDNARQDFAERYTKTRNLKLLKTVYSEAISLARSDTSAS